MNRLRELRKSQGLTLKDTVKKMKEQESLIVTADALAKYERGDREPKIETWQKFADFFKVSVPYLQGLTYTTDEVVKIVHEYYFEKDETEQLGTFNYDFVKDIDLYINLTSYDPVPRALYKKEAKDFPLTAKVKKYWLNHFKDILNSQRLSNINKGNKDDVIVSFDSEIEKDIAKFQSPYKATLLGKLYQTKFKNESVLHDDAIQKIEYLDLSAAKEAINKYAKLINELRDEVNNFEEDSFNQEDYDKNLIKDIKNQTYMMNLSSNKHVETEVDELINRIKNGDIDCRDYLITHNANLDFLATYRDYKKDRGEDTANIDECLKERDEILNYLDED